jgi:organic hydroperoxide reductase OsmC/OhrA
MSGTHVYTGHVAWSGSTADGYDGYDRRHAGSVPTGGFTLPLSSDAAFGGDPAVPNPEQLLVLAAASCHLLSFLAVAARARIAVLHYTDDASGEMPEVGEPVGLSVIRLRPAVVVADRVVGRGTLVDAARIAHLHEVAHRECYVANSLSTPIEVAPTLTLVPAGAP